MKKTSEEKDMENFVRLQAEQARGWQKAITEDEDLEKWVADGNLGFLERRVFDRVEQSAFQTIKNPAFDPSNLSQVAQLKALCQVVDMLKNQILSRVQAVRDARAKLQEQEMSTQEGD